MDRPDKPPVGSEKMGRLTVNLTDDLHAQVRKAAGTGSIAGFIREAVAEKLGRSTLEVEVAELRDRVDRLEKQIRRGT